MAVPRLERGAPRLRSVPVASFSMGKPEGSLMGQKFCEILPLPPLYNRSSVRKSDFTGPFSFFFGLFYVMTSTAIRLMPIGMQDLD